MANLDWTLPPKKLDWSIPKKNLDWTIPLAKPLPTEQPNPNWPPANKLNISPPQAGQGFSMRQILGEATSPLVGALRLQEKLVTGTPPQIPATLTPEMIQQGEQIKQQYETIGGEPIKQIVSGAVKPFETALSKTRDIITQTTPTIGQTIPSTPIQEGRLTAEEQPIQPTGDVIRPAKPEERLQPEIPISKEEEISAFAERTITNTFGADSLADLKSKQKQLGFVVKNAPLIATGMFYPLTALGIETYHQAKNVIVSSLKKEKYSPFETRMLSELLPKETPEIAKIGANIGESVGDIALLGGLINLAKQGLLKRSIYEVANKL